MRHAIRLALISTLLAAAGATAGRAADIPPLGERDVATFVAVQKSLVADESRADEFCSVHFSTDSGDDEAPADADGARIGRELDAHPYVGPLLRRHSISGQRFAQVTVQVVAGALGLAMADSLDETARAKGEAATNRAALLEKSSDARIVSAHLDAITAVLEQVRELCGEGGDDESDEQPEDGGSE